MFRRSAGRGAFLLVVTAAVSLSGCISLDLDLPILFEEGEELVIMPDGSGKLTMTGVMLFTDPQAEENERIAADTASAFREDSSFPKEMFQGVVAFKVQCETPCQGAFRWVCTAYFDDVNQFEYGELEARNTLRYQKLADGFSLEVNYPEPSLYVDELRDWSDEEGPVVYWKAIAESPVEGADPDGAKRAARAFAQRVLEGPRLWKTYTLPGEIKEAKAFTSAKGRTASLRLTWKDFQGLDDAEVAAKLEEIGGVRTIVCGPSSVSDEEVGAFRKELAKAKLDHGKL